MSVFRGVITEGVKIIAKSCPRPSMPYSLRNLFLLGLRRDNDRNLVSVSGGQEILLLGLRNEGLSLDRVFLEINH